ncbi:SusC/RagA family TonB-linked outer membrane protein [Daejeonella sp.]|jgi:TonB-linked SusC/RagA family outer membrane protein|uniref:SusC/RagA family TonB-linked outer membrane protein n=1 Tax=Daejeonella sp. TaxID=2805397 RepID=UPI0037BECFA8
MKKLLQSLFLLLFIAFQAIAQERTVTGTVTDKTDGLPLPGVSIKVKGSNAGTSTGVDGKFTLKVPANVKTLVVSYIGFLTKEIEISNGALNVALEADSKLLNEVVITAAYGTKQTPRAATNNVQTVTGEKLNVIRSTNVNNALAGKVAGVQVRSQSAAALGRNTEVRLRGGNGFGTGNGALYVVDGTILPNADDLNLDDVESVSVLQGPAAAALLGSQGANGAIIITTKKGKSSGGAAGVTINAGVTFEDPYVLPNYQNSYAGGSVGSLMKYTWKASDPAEWKALDGKYYHDYSDDTSWGPRMVGQEYIPWYAWYGGTQYSYKTTALVPQPDNARDYYNTGATYNNSVSYGTGNDRSNFKLTYNNQYTNGLIPSSNLLKNQLQLVGSYEISKKFSVSSNINYVKQVLNGNIADDYSNLGSGAFNQWFHRNLDMGIMKELRGLTTPGIGGNIITSWNHFNPTSYNPNDPMAFDGNHYWYNMFSYADLEKSMSQRDRLYGNISFTYKVNNDLKFVGAYRKQQNTAFNEGRTYSILERSGSSTGVRNAYSTRSSYSNRENYELVGTYSKKIKDFTVDANAGLDFFVAKSNGNNANTNNGLSIPDLFTVNNSVDAPSVGNSRSQDKYRALFGRFSVGYKNFLFLDGSLRNDWFSTLPVNNNDVMSKSIGASFVFSDLLPKSIKGTWLSEAKLRASWGEVPQSLGAYAYPGAAYGVGTLKWDGNLLMATPDQLVDESISGAVQAAKEIGLDLKLFNRRLSTSFTLWDKSEVGIPRSVSINATSGLSSILTNIGRINSKGLEVQVGLEAFSRPNFSWNVSATYSNLLDNKVVEISNKYGINSITAATITFGLPSMVHRTGQQWGELYGTGMLRNDAGVPILDANGLYQVAAAPMSYGLVTPKHVGGLQNSFSLFKMFDINANIDYSIGGKFSSLSNMWGSYSGLTARTATVNDKGMSIRDDVADGGGVRVDGVDAAGVPVTKYVPAQTYFANFYNRKIWDPYVYDLTFVKLREVSIGYRIPVKKLGLDKYVQNASFALVARNPLILFAKTKDFDPSEVSGSAGENSQLPGTRGIGFNLRVAF